MKKRSKCNEARMDYHLSIRLSKEEYDLIDVLAKKKGITKANLIMGIFLKSCQGGNK